MKDLPYFKFIISEWTNGNITLCSMEAQGLFINLCAVYWSSGCTLSYTKAKRRYYGCNTTVWKELINEGIIKVSNDKISINFLDEQLSERKTLSEQNAQNVSKRWKKDTTVLPSNNARNGSVYNKEERREEKSIYIHNYAFNKSFALISNTPYLLPEERGINPVGRNIDEIVMQLKEQGFEEAAIYARTRAMKSIYGKQKLTFPVKVETFIESFTAKDWIKELQGFDPEKQVEQFQKNLKDANRKQPEPDLIGSSQPGTLG